MIMLSPVLHKLDYFSDIERRNNLVTLEWQRKGVILLKAKSRCPSTCVIFQVRMHGLWKKLAFQPCDGGLSHAPVRWAGRRQGEALPTELQGVRGSSNGRARRLPGEH